jgi:hypothetical protein
MSGDNEKETVPPPPDVEVEEEEAPQERTVLARVPEDLIAELQRREEPESNPSGPPSAEGGLRQMFARNPMHIRDVLPTEAEGDALLDMLFDDATQVQAPKSDRAAIEAGRLPVVRDEEDDDP